MMSPGHQKPRAVSWAQLSRAFIVCATTQTVITERKVRARGRSVRMFAIRVRSLMPWCRQWSWQRNRETESVSHSYKIRYVFILTGARLLTNRRIGEYKGSLSLTFPMCLMYLNLSANLAVV